MLRKLRGIFGTESRVDMRADEILMVLQEFKMRTMAREDIRDEDLVALLERCNGVMSNMEDRYPGIGTGNIALCDSILDAIQVVILRLQQVYHFGAKELEEEDVPIAAALYTSLQLFFSAPELQLPAFGQFAESGLLIGFHSKQHAFQAKICCRCMLDATKFAVARLESNLLDKAFEPEYSALASILSLSFLRVQGVAAHIISAAEKVMTKTATSLRPPVHEALQRTTVGNGKTKSSSDIYAGFLHGEHLNQRSIQEVLQITQWQSVGTGPSGFQVAGGCWARELCENDCLFFLFFECLLGWTASADPGGVPSRRHIFGYPQLLELFATKLCIIAAAGDSYRAAAHGFKVGAVAPEEHISEKGNALEMKGSYDRSLENTVIHCCRSLGKLDPSLLGVIVAAHFSTCRSQIPSSCAHTLAIVDHLIFDVSQQNPRFTGLYHALGRKRGLDFFFLGLDIFLTSGRASNAQDLLKFIYFRGQMLVESAGDYENVQDFHLRLMDVLLLKKHFRNLFCHWHADVRAFYHHILIFRLFRSSRYQLRPGIDGVILREFAVSSPRKLPHEVTHIFSVANSQPLHDSDKVVLSRYCALMKLMHSAITSGDREVCTLGVNPDIAPALLRTSFNEYCELLWTYYCENNTRPPSQPLSIAAKREQELLEALSNGSTVRDVLASRHS